MTRRQGIIYDMGLVDQLFSICCNLEQFNLASPPGADANSSSQYGASAGSATSGRSRLSHDHVCKDPEEGHIRRLCANCFQVLTLLVRKNHILGMHLAAKFHPPPPSLLLLRVQLLHEGAPGSQPGLSLLSSD